MDLFWKAIAVALIVSVLALFLEKAGRDYTITLILAAALIIIYASFYFIEPALSFLKRLEQIGNLNSSLLEVLLKILGIGITAELTGNICADAGNTSLQKEIHLLGSAAILYLSLPVYTSLLELLQQILENV